MNRNHFILITVVVSLVVLGWGFLKSSSLTIRTASYGEYSYQHPDKGLIKIQLLDPETAPQDVKAKIMEGYRVLQETQKHAREYSGDSLNCRSCHFAAGNTLGGFNNGISLVGVSGVYPKKLENGDEQSLRERVNQCFVNSMNGKAMPLDSPLMDSIVAYLEWISKGVVEVETYPWLGLSKLKSLHQPDAVKGKRVYVNRCSECHGDDGQGLELSEGLSVPPLWGERSFNSKAGMNVVSTFASFVYYNMPYDDVGISEEEALDVAAFVLSQPRN